MDDRERLEHGIDLLREARWADFTSYLAKLRNRESLLSSLLEVARLMYANSHSEVIRKGARLLARVSDKPQLASYLFDWLGIAHGFMGEMETAANYFLKEMEIAEATGDQAQASRAKTRLLNTRFMKAEYESVYREVKDCIRGGPLSDNYIIHYLMATLEIVMGRPERAAELLGSSLAIAGTNRLKQAGIKEVLGSAHRMMGKNEEAIRLYIESTSGYLEVNSAYAAFPLAKAMELSRLLCMDFPPRSLMRKCLVLARKGSWGEMAAAQEIEALLIEDDAGAGEGLFEAAKNYSRVYQNIEACMAGLMAAYLGWRAENHIFPKAIRFLAPLAPLHPGFKRDPILGRFLTRVESFLEDESERKYDRGIRAHLIDGLRVSVNGKEIRLARRGNRKALRALVYLLLTPKHRIPMDHLFYLLWPRERYTKRTRQWLYIAIVMIRKDFGINDLLTRKHDYYQLEEVWTDLGELENLLLRADALHDPVEKEELLARAKELAKGELLPDFPYDSYIDEYRQYYERMRKRMAAE